MKNLDVIARQQWGLVTHAQARKLLTKGELATLLRNGYLLPVHRGVYRVAGAPVTWLQQIFAAQLAINTEAVVSHLSAARLHGLVVQFDDIPHLTIGPQCSHMRNDVVLHRSVLAASEIVVVRRFLCTSVERTIVDLASMLTRRQLTIVIDEAVVAGKTTFSAVDRALSATRTVGKRGIATLRAVLELRLPLPAEITRAIELKVAKAVNEAGLPMPETEYRVITKYGPYFIDLAWPQFMIGAEADGYNVHTASRIRHTDDRRRRNELETLGWRILNFTYDMSVAEIAAVLRNNLERPKGA